MLVFLSPGSAGAIDVQEGAQRRTTFAGAGCGSIQTQQINVPAGARHIRGSADKGVPLADAVTGQIVARLTSRLVGTGAQRAVVFAATGTGDVCVRPAIYADKGWRTTPTELSAGWLIQRRAFFRSFNDDATTKARYRPHLIRFGDHGLIRIARWSQWNGDRARARGRVRVGRQRRSLPARIVLSEAWGCRGQVRYLLLRVRVIGPRPDGVRRRYSERFGCF